MPAAGLNKAGPVLFCRPPLFSGPQLGTPPDALQLLTGSHSKFTEQKDMGVFLEVLPAWKCYLELGDLMPALSSLYVSFLSCRIFLPASTLVCACSQGDRQSPGERISLQNFSLQRAEIPSINHGEGSEEWLRLPHQPTAHFSRRGRGNFCQDEIGEFFPKWPCSSITCVSRTEGRHGPLCRVTLSPQSPQWPMNHFAEDRQRWGAGGGENSRSQRGGVGDGGGVRSGPQHLVRGSSGTGPSGLGQEGCRRDLCLIGPMKIHWNSCVRPVLATITRINSFNPHKTLKGTYCWSDNMIYCPN